MINNKLLVVRKWTAKIVNVQNKTSHNNRLRNPILQKKRQVCHSRKSPHHASCSQKTQSIGTVVESSHDPSKQAIHGSNTNIIINRYLTKNK